METSEWFSLRFAASLSSRARSEGHYVTRHYQATNSISLAAPECVGFPSSPRAVDRSPCFREYTGGQPEQVSLLRPKLLLHDVMISCSWFIRSCWAQETNRSHWILSLLKFLSWAGHPSASAWRGLRGLYAGWYMESASVHLSHTCRRDLIPSCISLLV